jgi:hypothetical protein
MSSEYVPISLPSRGKPYEVDPLSIKVRTFKGKDEQLIVQMPAGNPKKKILEVMRNVVQGMDPIDMTIGDIMHILLWEAINSYTSIYPVTMICEKCFEEIKINADLGRIESHELPEDYQQDYSVTLNGQAYKIRLLTLGDEVEIMGWAQKQDASYLYAYAMSLEDGSPDIYKKVLMLEELSSKELNKVRQYHAHFEHGPDFMAPYVCPKCGESGKVVVPFRLDDIIQFTAKA